MQEINNQIIRMVEDEMEALHDEYEVDDYPGEDYVAQDRADFAERVSRDRLPIVAAGAPINGARDAPRSVARAYLGV